MLGLVQRAAGSVTSVTSFVFTVLAVVSAEHRAFLCDLIQPVCCASSRVHIPLVCRFPVQTGTPPSPAALPAMMSVSLQLSPVNLSLVSQVEKEACETKLSKLRLQSKAKVTSLTAQLEELKRRGDPASPAHNKKVSAALKVGLDISGAASIRPSHGGLPLPFQASSEGAEHASRGKIVLLKKKVEELEQQLAHRDQDLENQVSIRFSTTWCRGR